MSEASPTPAAGEAVLEVVSPDGARRYARVVQSPFLIGRGAETGNHLQLTDRRISRECAAIIVEGNKFHIEDRGQRRGLFVNNEKVESRELKDGDIITSASKTRTKLFFVRRPQPANKTCLICSRASKTSLVPSRAAAACAS